MGNIYGDYDAKGEGFGPGCSSLHLTMTPHGPDFQAFESGTKGSEEPVKLGDTLSFMFETCYVLKLAKNSFVRDRGYIKCWESLEDKFQI